MADPRPRQAAIDLQRVDAGDAEDGVRIPASPASPQEPRRTAPPALLVVISPTVSGVRVYIPVVQAGQRRGFDFLRPSIDPTPRPPPLGAQSGARAPGRVGRHRPLRPAHGRPRADRRGRELRGRRVRLGHALPPGRAALGRRRPARHHAEGRRAVAHAGDWGWMAILPGNGLLPEDFPEPWAGTFDLRDGALRRGDPGRARADRSLPRHDGDAPRRPRDPPSLPAPQGRRQHGHAPPGGRLDAVAAGVVRGRPVLLRRPARGAGRRRGVRDRRGVPHEGVTAPDGGGAHDPAPALPHRRGRSPRPTSRRATSARWACTRT